MNEYELRALIDELGKLILAKQSTINSQEYQIKNLKAEVERLEELLTPRKKVGED